MSNELICVNCGELFDEPEASPGDVVRCPHCHTEQFLPPADTDDGRGSSHDDDPSHDDHDGDDHDHDEHDAHHGHDPLTFKPKKEFHDLIDMTAMVDIVFFLLIYFLVTSMTQLKPAIPMPPTEQSGSGGNPSSGDADRDLVVARIDEKDVVYVDDVAIPSERDLRAKLEGIVSAGGPTTLKIMGSPDATHGTLVMVMDAGAAAGMQKVQLAIKSLDE